MWDSLTPWIVPGGAVGIAGSAVLAVIKGWLVPRRVLDDVRQDRDERVDEANKRADDRVGDANKRAEEWRSAFLAAEESRRQLSMQVETALESMTTVTRLVGHHREQP